MKLSVLLRGVACLAFIGLIPGCDYLPVEYQDRLQALWKIVGPSAKESPKPSPDAKAQFGVTAQAAQENAELLQEIYKVVTLSDPRSRSEFGNWVDSMNQGASLEGVYNGFTHSSEYRKLEATGPGASPDALKVFGTELAQLTLELPEPTRFIDASGETVPLRTGFEWPKGQETPQPPDLTLLASEYSAQFVGATIFTLKRVIGDEALKVIEAKYEYSEKFAFWYSKWVVRLCSYSVNYGLELRSRPDEAFHYQWAAKASRDRLTWEVLNRLHRLLNEANSPKQ